MVIVYISPEVPSHLKRFLFRCVGAINTISNFAKLAEYASGPLHWLEIAPTVAVRVKYKALRTSYSRS